MKNLILAILAFGVIIGMTSCANYDDTQLGEVTVAKKGAFIRTEGGGVDSIARMAGCNYIADPFIEVETFDEQYTPKTINIQMDVVMAHMQNQSMTWNMTLNYSKNPYRYPHVFANFKTYNEQIEKVFRETCMNYLSKLDVVSDIDSLGTKGKKTGTDVENLWNLSKEVLAQTKDNFVRQFPEFKDDFNFNFAVIANYSLPERIRTSFEKVAAQRYKTKLQSYESEKKKLEADLKTMDSDADLAAFSKEAGNVNNEVLQYYSFDLIEDFMADENTHTTIFIPMDKYGNILWFQARYAQAPISNKQ
jgi:regulator of protease activity HflC (stomatin/prohibitin superfamily)